MADLESSFCLQPPGDTDLRRGLFDCMMMGGVPVVLKSQRRAVSMILDGMWLVPWRIEDVVVFIDAPTNARGVYVDLLQRLQTGWRARARHALKEITHRLQIALPSPSSARRLPCRDYNPYLTASRHLPSADAFDLAMLQLHNTLLEHTKPIAN